MTKDQWYELAGQINALWEQRSISQESIEAQYAAVADIPPEQAHTALLSLYEEGREWPPNSGQIRRRAVELGHDRDDQGWAEGWRLAKQALLNGSDDPRRPSVLDLLQDSEPIAARVVERLGGNQWSFALDDEVSERANFRAIWQQLATEGRDDKLYRNLDPAGLKRLERIHHDPRQFPALEVITRKEGSEA